MGTILAIKGFSWLAGTCILLALAMATAAQWAVFATIGAACMQFGYIGYQWAKAIYSDVKTGKKKLPFKKSKP